MGPFVLILSYGSTKPIEIVQKLHSSKANSSESNSSQELKIGENIFPTYSYSIKNKYFETIVKLIPFDGPISTLPEEISNSTEALIVTFDSTDKSFPAQIPKLCEFVEKNSIELGFLITTELYDGPNEGLSYADVKEACKANFDVVEILSKDDEATSTTNEEDYSEIIEALENHVWSNVASPGGSKKQSISQADEDIDEEQLEAYEHLLTSIVNFKSNSSNLNRDQFMDQAEKLAEMFSDLMGDD